MKATVAWLAVLLLVLAGSGTALAANLKDKVKVEVNKVALQPEMDPGTYVCAAGHFHIRGTVQNLAAVALSHIKVKGEVFGPTDQPLATATALIRQPVLKPGEKTNVDVEFLALRGPRVRQVKRYELTVIEAYPSP